MTVNTSRSQLYPAHRKLRDILSGALTTCTLVKKSEPAVHCKHIYMKHANRTDGLLCAALSATAGSVGHGRTEMGELFSMPCFKPTGKIASGQTARPALG